MLTYFYASADHLYVFFGKNVYSDPLPDFYQAFFFKLITVSSLYILAY